MKLEKMVCSLENAKKLAELGVKVESTFYWELNSCNKYFKGKVSYGDPSIDNAWAIPFPAYTAADIGEMLPCFYLSWKGKVNMLGWTCETESDEKVGVDFSAETEADARALMLIWLIENGHLKVENINGN